MEACISQEHQSVKLETKHIVIEKEIGAEPLHFLDDMNRMHFSTKCKVYNTAILVQN